MSEIAKAFLYIRILNIESFFWVVNWLLIFKVVILHAVIVGVASKTLRIVPVCPKPQDSLHHLLSQLAQTRSELK